MASPTYDTWGGSWGSPSAWGASWGEDPDTPTGDGEAAAIVWSLKRRRKKQLEQRTEHQQLPSIAALLEALED